MTTSIMWFRRDLRLADNPALVEAAEADEVIGVFVLDPVLWGDVAAPRAAVLARSLASLDESMGGNLVVREGRPAEIIASLAAEVEADTVFAAADFAPYGARRDVTVQAALAAGGRSLELVGAPYAVAPGSIFTNSGTPYKVFTPFSKLWVEHGWDDPVDAPDVAWRSVDGDGLPDAAVPDGLDLPELGEDAAWERAKQFLADDVDDYDDQRNRPDLDATSRLSVDLKWGHLHPRQLLDRLGRSDGATTFRSELAWREFYADVLYHRPASAWESMNPRTSKMVVDSGPAADEDFERWAAGETGFPIVDAGMRQLLAEGWMHNRVRMITASFLVKDLHLPWQRGAQHFLDHLIDADLGSNQHGWQWVAGTGTDAAPYFRVFNPTSQGKKFDPDGDYVRRYVPELADVAKKHVHEPHGAPDGAPEGYPDPIVDHKEAREEALRRYEATGS